MKQYYKKKKKNTVIAVTIQVLIFVLLSHGLVTPDSGNILQFESQISSVNHR